MDKEQLISELARTHGVRVRPDDPVLLLATLYQVCLAEGEASIRKIVTDAQDQIAASNIQEIEAAKATSARLISDAAGFAADTIREAGLQAARSIQEETRRELAAAQAAVKSVRRAAYALSFLVAALLAGGIGFFLAGYFRS